MKNNNNIEDVRMPLHSTGFIWDAINVRLLSSLLKDEYEVAGT